MNYGEVWPIKTLTYGNFVSGFGRFDDFDDAIDEAIEEDIRELCDGEWTIWGIKTLKISPLPVAWWLGGENKQQKEGQFTDRSWQ